MRYGRIPGVEKDVSRVGQGLVMMKEDRQDEGFALLDAAHEGAWTLPASPPPAKAAKPNF